MSSIRATSRKNRVFVFRDFIRQTYPYLTPDAVILDVAGGKGDLSWLLTNVDGWQSIVVDPRPTSDSHWKKRIDFLREHPEEAKERAIPGRPTYQPLAALLEDLPSDLRKPRHLQLWVDDKLVEALRATLVEGVDEAWVQYWDEHVISKASAEDCIRDAAQALSLFQECQLLVGFHPDQALDAIIELAQDVLHIPYCVVPCCVFPALFPDRRQPDGSRVRTYDQLVAYHERQSACLRAQLAFDQRETQAARDVVLYTTSFCRPVEPRLNDEHANSYANVPS